MQFLQKIFFATDLKQQTNFILSLYFFIIFLFIFWFISVMMEEFL